MYFICLFSTKGPKDQVLLSEQCILAMSLLPFIKCPVKIPSLIQSQVSSIKHTPPMHFTTSEIVDTIPPLNDSRLLQDIPWYI